MSQRVSRKVFLAVVLALIIVVAGSTRLNSPVTSGSQPQFLDVSISPPGPVMLSVNQTQLFTAEVANQSLGPFSYAWTDENGTLLGSDTSYLFTSQGFTSERLYLTVTSKDGQIGYAYVDLKDPYATQSIYLDPLLSGGASLEIQYDGVGSWQIVNDSGNQIFSNSNLTLVEQNATDILAPSGGLIILRETIWNSSVAIPSNIAVLSYYQGTINYYGSNGIQYNGVSLATTSSFPTYPYANLTGVPVFLLANGSQALTANWNVGGYTVYNVAWLNSTSINLGSLFWNNQNMTGIFTSYPYANLTGVPNTFPYANLTGVPNTFPYSNLTGVPIFLLANGTQPLTGNWNTGSYSIYGVLWLNATSVNLNNLYVNGQNMTQIFTSYPYANLTGVPQTFPYANLTGVPNTFPYGNLTGVPSTFPYGNLTGAPKTWPWGNITGVPILLYANGTQALTSNWNMGASGTYGISGLSWVNATSITVSGTGTFGNVVSTEPIGDYTYLVYNDPITGRCTAKAANGTICWSASGWDATPVIQSAISAINATPYPGTIHFSLGQYPVDNLNITGKVTLQGTGAVAQIACLYQDGPGNVMNYLQSDSEYGFAIRDMEIAGASNNYATGSGLYVAPQVGQEFADVMIDRVFFYGFPAYGVYTTCSWGWIIENSIFEYNCVNNTADYGLYVGGNPPQAVITNNKIISNYGNGLYCGSGNSMITYNQIGSNAGTGACLNGSNDVSFSNNLVNYNGGNGIDVLSGAWKSSISGNHIFFNGGEGLHISADSPYCTVSNNVFHANTGIQAYISGSMCTVSSNNFDLGMSQGLEIKGSGSIVTGNLFNGNGNSTTCQFALITDNCTIMGNTFNGDGLSGYGIQVSKTTSDANDLIINNNFYGHIGTYWNFQNAVYLSMPCLAIFRGNTGINLLNAGTTYLYRLGGVGCIFALGRDAIYGAGNATSTWTTGQTYTVEAFDVNVYLSGGGNSTTVVVNGNTIVSAAQITTLSIPAPVGTTITITDSSSMPTISIVPVPQ
jgi:hypothetical protein